MPVETELYEILEIHVSADVSEIKKAYRKKALQCHPDKGGDEEQFKKVNAAYEVLSDPEKKDLYDKHGKNGLKNEGVIPEDVFRNMFGNMFGNGFRTGMNMFNNVRNAIRKTQPTVHQYNVSLEDLCTRKVVKLKFERELECPCSTGEKASGCSQCKGRGATMQVRQLGPGMFQQLQQTCGTCKGRGKIYSSCENCKEGVRTVPKVFQLHLTPELENGYKYVFNGEGNQALGYEQGDFIVVIVYKSHDIFECRGKDLFYVHDLDLKDALCGHTICIQHPSGEEISFTVPEVVNPNSKRTIVGKGLTNEGVMEVTFNITFPTNISEEQKKSLLKIL